MHSNTKVIAKLYSGLQVKDHRAMAECYHENATFRDIAYSLEGKNQIHAMWHLICETDLTAAFTVKSANDLTGDADLIDDYTFKDTGRRIHNEIKSHFQFQDGLIIAHHDDCNAVIWGQQAFGYWKGLVVGLIPFLREQKAKSLLAEFIKKHPEYS